MGFFSWVTDKIGRGIEKIGEITHIGFIEDIGLNMQIYNPFDRLKRTDTNSITHDELGDINAACEECRRSADMQAKDIAEECIEKIEDKVNSLKIQFPEDIIGNNDYSLSKAFKNEIKESVSAYVARKVSIDNEEFRKILDMNGSAREEKSNEFIKRTLSEAGKELDTKCKNKFISIVKMMINDIDEYCDRQRDYMQEIEDAEERLKECENDIETKKALIRENIIEASMFESIRTLTYSN